VGGGAGGRRGVAKLLATGLLLDAAAADCTGASVDLRPDQCVAWGKIFDAAGGPNWTGAGNGCSKQDPCACGSGSGGHRCGVAICGVSCYSGNIGQM
jgi:hypothetical protein